MILLITIISLTHKPSEVCSFTWSNVMINAIHDNNEYILLFFAFYSNNPI